MVWKKFIIGEKMPDKADPQYKERYEKEVEAGRRFARWTRIDLLAAKIQRWALGHQRTFLCIVFGVVIGCFIWNIIGITRTISERQEQLLDSLRSDKFHKNISKWALQAVD